MNYIIFDLEWNQASSDLAVVREPVYLTGEIIQIGAVKLNEEFEVTDELRLYIKPQYYTKMHRKIASLTGIHDKVLAEQGLPFPEAFEKFQEWCGEEFAYMTWSMSDLPMLVENMQLHGIGTQVLPVCYDIQRIFSREIMRCSRRFALDSAIATLGERGDVAHDALHDARNTAIVCSHLDLDAYLDEYAAGAFGVPPIDREFESISAMLADEELKTFVCPWCGSGVKCDAWYSDVRTWIGMGVCQEEEDEFYIELRPEKTHAGTYRVSGMLYEMSDDLYEIYEELKNK